MEKNIYPLSSECFQWRKNGKDVVYAVRMFYTLQSAFTCLNANVSDNELGGEYYLHFT